VRLGLFGGRFDPPHFGHLLLAEQARDALSLDEVRFLPAGDPPHKGVRASAEARLTMTRLATDNHPDFRVDDREVRRAGPSYAIDTVEELRRERPDAELWYLIGADAYAEIATWHRAEEFVRSATVVVVPRPGTSRADVDALDEPFRSAPRRLDIVACGLSSTLLRRRIRQGRSLRYLTPDAVARYLHARRLYAAHPEEAP
jgi:nicotinate-nucleotide adenylyltransferase